MQISFKLLVSQNFLRRIFNRTHIDNIQDPNASRRTPRNQKGSHSLQNNSPDIDKLLLIQFFLVNVDVHEVDVNEIEKFCFQLREIEGQG